MRRKKTCCDWGRCESGGTVQMIDYPDGSDIVCCASCGVVAAAEAYDRASEMAQELTRLGEPAISLTPYLAQWREAWTRAAKGKHWTARQHKPPRSPESASC